MEPLVTRIGYLQGASPQRPIEPVHSVMEEYVRKNGMPEQDEPVTPAVVIVCPCGTVHDGSHGLGLRKGNVKLCVDCYREKRLAGLREAMAERKAIIAKAKEPRIVSVDFREWKELYSMIQKESRDCVRTPGQQILFLIKKHFGEGLMVKE